MRIIDILNSPWAILPETYNEIRAIYETHLRGDKIDIKAIEAELGSPLENKGVASSINGNVATINIHGILAKKMNMFQKISGGMSTQMIMNSLAFVSEKDNGVDTIILDIDSPGGTVEGTALLADYIFSLRDKFHIVAVANEIMGSAAYWIGSAAHETYAATVTSQIGSIGAIIEHIDVSEQDKLDGKKVTVISSGDQKAIGNPHQKLTKHDREEIQLTINYAASVFIGAVARNLGVDESVVEAMADGGRLYIGQQAVDIGLVAGVQTLEQIEAKFLTEQTESVPEPGNVIVLGEDELIDDLVDNNTEVNMKITELRDKHPDLYAQVIAEGAGTIDADALTKAASEKESARIKSVLAVPMAEHYPEIIQAMAYDGVSTPEMAALKVLEAEKAKTSATAQDLKDDGESITGISAGMGDDDTVGESNLPLEQRAKSDWDKSTDIRAEFYNNFDGYLAFLTATSSGHVKQLKGA